MVNMKKTLVSIAVGSAITVASSTTAYAALPADANLSFDPMVTLCKGAAKPNPGTPPDNCNYGSKLGGGSYFTMDASGDGNQDFPTEYTGINSNGVIGINIGKTQSTEGDIDNAWVFFCNAGNHTTVSNATILSDDTAGNVTLDFSGWNVSWNGIPFINMAGGTQDCGTTVDGVCIKDGVDVGGIKDNGTGIAAVVCVNNGDGVDDCSDGDNYTLDYNAVVPFDDASGFGGVVYALHLEGAIGLQASGNTAPVAVADSFTVDRKASGRAYTSPVLDIVANDTDADGVGDIDRTTVAIVATPNGTFTRDLVTGDITYTPVDDSLASDSFTYQVSDKGGPQGVGFELTSGTATVNITVQNAVPVANNDLGLLDTASAASLDISVLDNDTDSDGTIDETSIVVTGAPASGGTTVNSTTGIITYTPNPDSIGPDTFTYTVNDNDGVTSNQATVTVTVSNSAIGTMPPNAYLTIDPGNTDGTTVSEPADGNGSWFHMEVKPNQLTFVSLAGFNGIAMGVGNKQGGSVPFPNIDNPWSFFGQLGIHQTTTDVTILTDDGNGAVTLDLSGWDVSWNNIASIPLNARAQVAGFVDSIAQVTCMENGDGVADCSFGDKYILEYSATVPDGDPSNFGNVKYFLHLEGVISNGVPGVGGGNPLAPFNVTTMTAIDANGIDIATKPGSVAGSVGNTSGINLSQADVGKDPQLNTTDGQQCIGGCIDFVVENVTTNYVDLTFKLSTALPAGAIYRKLYNGTWKDYDQSQGDIIGSAVSNASGGCQRPEGEFSAGLREGFDCIYMRIYDNGPNDTDSTVGTIADPSGALLAGSSNVPAGTSSGCSISGKPVSLISKADWVVVFAFVALLGLKTRISRRNS